MRRAVYPGTFDPITKGHLDILRHAAALFDEVVIAVLHNAAKAPMFDLDTRLELARDAVASFTNCRVDSFAGLLVTYYQREGFDAVIRGVRNPLDLQSEMSMAQMNESLLPDIHTLFIPSSAGFSFVSSTLVKDVAMHGGDVSNYVTPTVEQALRSVLK